MCGAAKEGHMNLVLYFVSQGANDWSERSSNPTSYGRSKAPTLHPSDVEDVQGIGVCVGRRKGVTWTLSCTLFLKAQMIGIGLCPEQYQEAMRSLSRFLNQK